MSRDAEQSRDIKQAREIADALGGIPKLAEVCGVQYRLAYGYVDRNSIPAHYDLNLVAALKAAGSDIDLHSIARWRACLANNDSKCQHRTQDARENRPKSGEAA